MLDEYIIVKCHSQYHAVGYLAGEPNPDPDGEDGVVTVDDVPAAREVRVHERATGRLVATTFSNPDGTWRIDGLNPALEFDVIGRDWSRQWMDVIQGAVRPEPYEP